MKILLHESEDAGEQLLQGAAQARLAGQGGGEQQRGQGEQPEQERGHAPSFWLVE
jgi:hypothetical protein